MAKRRMFSFRVLIVLCSAALVCAYVLYRGDALPWSSSGSKDSAPLKGAPVAVPPEQTFMPGSKFERAFTPPAGAPEPERVMSGSKSAVIIEPGDLNTPASKSPLTTLPPATSRPADQQPKP